MNAGSGLREETLQAGLLMEGAQAHQAMVTENLQRLQAHIRDLDTVVRDEIRRTLLEELQGVTTESQRAVKALQQATRSAGGRMAVVAHSVVLLATLVPAGAIFYATPSPSEFLALRSQRADLESALQRLREQGARVEWRRCGEERRLCVRVDRKAPVFGEQADYFIVRGY
jgi:hypothetical protein